MQIHFGETDSRRDERVVAEFASRVRRAGAVVEEHVYPTSMHHFADPDWPGYDSAAAESMFQHLLVFLAAI